MKKRHLLSIMTLIIAGNTQQSFAHPQASHHEISQQEIKALKVEAIAIVKQFGGTLKPQLKQAMKAGGPIQAIEVCSQTAPQIAEQLTQSSGWQVKRVSLKARNDKSALPNEWEKQVLTKFDQRNAQGETAQKMAYAEVVDGEFRFMKAQGVEPLCLKCHGSDISEDVKATLNHHYPNDMATGYKKGQIRGAFSLTKKL